MKLLVLEEHTHAGPRRRRKRLVLISLLLLIAGGAVLLLALEYRPAWYAPRGLTESELQQGRMEAMRLIDLVGDQLVARTPFEIALTADQLNIWLSGLTEIWPDAARRIPSEIMEPYVAFEAGSLRTAARLESKGWRAIVSCEYVLELSPDKKMLIVRLGSARCGSVTLPRFFVRSFFKPYIDAETMGGFTIDQLYEGIQVTNRFVWPNGKRFFRLVQLTIEPKRIRLRIEPL